VSTFLSDDWFAELEQQVSAAQPDPDVTLTIEQLVHSDELGPTVEEPIRWQIHIEDGHASLERPGQRDPDVRVRCDSATAAGIADGTTSAPRAFLDGRLKIGGDLHALINHRVALGRFGPTDPMG